MDSQKLKPIASLQPTTTILFAVLSRPARHQKLTRYEKSGLGLKKIDDATTMRRCILIAFERAEDSDDEAERRRVLTLVIVGGGRLGWSWAGALAELAKAAPAISAYRSDDRPHRPGRSGATAAAGLSAKAVRRCRAGTDPARSRAAFRRQGRALRLREISLEVRHKLPAKGRDWLRCLCRCRRFVLSSWAFHIFLSTHLRRSRRRGAVAAE
jgi:hypothetical protein